MAGPRTLDQHIVPTLAGAAQTAGKPSPKVVAGALVCVTNDEEDARSQIASGYEMAGQVREYRAMLVREGVAGPEDVAVVGDETGVTRQLERFADAGVTELAAAPFGTPLERDRTMALLADLTLTGSGKHGSDPSANDRAAIHELIALHGHLADDRRPEVLSLLLTADAIYDVSAFGLGIVEGLPAIRQLHEQRPGTQPVGHHVTNIVIDRQADGTVAVRSKGLAVMADGTSGTCTYDDIVTCTTAGWRITRRRILGPRAD